MRLEEKRRRTTEVFCITKFVERIKAPRDLGKHRSALDASRKALKRLFKARPSWPSFRQPSDAHLGSLADTSEPYSFLLKPFERYPNFTPKGHPAAVFRTSYCHWDKRMQPVHLVLFILVLMVKCFACGTACKEGRGLANHYNKCPVLQARHAEGANHAIAVDTAAEAAAAAALVPGQPTPLHPTQENLAASLFARQKNGSFSLTLV
ncbi:hypothetical protein C8R44DRAFT_737026 [Mycena epipterygia]|nr:hypothetical protein C8R44DRAFT_737026 [Mycena epipterygia]